MKLFRVFSKKTKSGKTSYENAVKIKEKLESQGKKAEIKEEKK